jgi:hypothetical protein
MSVGSGLIAVTGDDHVLLSRAADPAHSVADLTVEGADGVSLGLGFLFVGASSGVRVFGVESFPPEPVASWNTRPIGAVSRDGSRLFACQAQKGGAVQILDVGELPAIRLVGRIGRDPESVYHGIEHPLDVAARGNIVCVMDYCFGLKAFDISRPDSPAYLGGHYRFSRWWKVVSFRACMDERQAFVGLRAALEVVNLPRRASRDGDGTDR